jgi:hypothetical protein
MKLKRLWFDADYIFIETEDGEIGRFLLARSSRLSAATTIQRMNYRLMRSGIHWDDVDEDISFDGFFEEQKDIERAIEPLPELERRLCI